MSIRFFTTFCLLFFTLSFLSGQGLSKAQSISIIPVPTELSSNGESFTISGTTQILVNGDDADVIRIVQAFADRINRAKHYNLKVVSGNPNDHAAKSTIVFQLNNLDKYGPEGYSLNVSSSQINVQAAKANGIFYAIQTLYQLLPADIYSQKAIGAISLEIPGVEIFDKPRFGWRGNMLDPSRHFISTEYIKQNLDYLASLKMNRFHWHLTDDQGWRIEIKKYPKLTDIGAWRVDRNDEEWWSRAPQQEGEIATYGGFYSQDEIKEIVQYAADRFIEIIPEIDIPGHSRSAIAAYPEISCDGKHYTVATGGIMEENTYCPGKEKTFEFTENVLAEVMELFPFEYVHIGGDECNKSAWKKCKDCQNRMSKESLKDEIELQSYFITRVEKLINASGKKMIGWDEILEGGLAPNATVMSWRGINGGIEAAKAGHKVVMSPNQYCYLDLKQGDSELEPDYGYSRLLLSTAYAYDPIPTELTSEEAKLILGVQGNLWGESMQTPFDLNYMMFPRLFAIAEVAWSPQEKKNFDDFTTRLDKAFNRLEAMDVNYALSAYNVSISTSVETSNNALLVDLDAEIVDQIKYTLDGSDPLINGEIYKKPIPISKTTTVRAQAMVDGKPVGAMNEKEIIVHRAAGKKTVLTRPPSQKYDIGTYGLTDCIRGNSDFSNRKWMGFDGDDFEGVLDLEKLQKAKSISVSFLHNTKSWIFLPEQIEISVSSDGKDYQLIESFDNTSFCKEPGKYIKVFSSGIGDQEIRFVKINARNIGQCPDWHPGNGGKAWVFVDEIMVF